MNVCHIYNPSYQVLLINLDSCFASVGLHEIIELIKLLLARVDRNFYGFTAFYVFTALRFYGITALCGLCDFC